MWTQKLDREEKLLGCISFSVSFYYVFRFIKRRFPALYGGEVKRLHAQHRDWKTYEHEKRKSVYYRCYKRTCDDRGVKVNEFREKRKHTADKFRHYYRYRKGKRYYERVEQRIIGKTEQ